MRRFLLWLTLIPAGWALGGPVQSLDQVPLALMNNDGDSLMLGDKKGLVFWTEASGASRGAALVLPSAASLAPSWTGGLADRTSDEPFRAIACSNSNGALYHPERDSEHPAGRWTPFTTSGPLLCAMSRSGHYAILNGSRLTLDGGTPLLLAAKPARLLAAGERFLLLSTQGQGWWISRSAADQTWAISAPFSHGIGVFDANTRMSANASHLLATDDFNTRRLPLTADAVGIAESIAVTACERGSVCGLSLADDGSWLISGYWGHFLGQDRTLLGKLSLPVSAARNEGGVAIAHDRLGGHFVYLGRDDGDWGGLGATRQIQLTRSKTWLPSVGRAATPNEAWWRTSMHIEEARALAAKAGIEPAQVNVAMIDSGLEDAHPWLQDHRRLGPDAKDQNDSDDNGFVDDQWGYDFVKEKAGGEDEFGHGTHVAGLLMASLGGETFAVAPNLRLTVYRALDRYGKSSSIDLSRALGLARSQPIDVIHCSWGGGADTLALRDAFTAPGLPLVISSAGNDGLDSDQYPEVPKIYHGVIAVGATDKQGRVASFSNYGKTSVDFFTPGDDIVSTVRGQGFGSMSGTSMAAPLATGAYAWILGLLRTRFPESTQQALRETALQLLCSTADPLPGKARCGLIRLDKATQASLNLSQAPQ